MWLARLTFSLYYHITVSSVVELLCSWSGDSPTKNSAVYLSIILSAVTIAARSERVADFYYVAVRYIIQHVAFGI